MDFPPAAHGEVQQELEMGAKSELQKQFESFDAANPKVREMFDRFALRAIAAGHRHLSAKMIFERIRWETDIETVDAGSVNGRALVLNNNYTPYYSRDFMLRHPQYADFFYTRKVSCE